MDQDHSDLLFHTTVLTKSYRAEERNGNADTPKRHGVRFGPIAIPRGGVIALVGQSGTGKTTLFNLLAGLDSADRNGDGEGPAIRLDLGGGPIDIVADPAAFPRERVGFVFQSGFLLRNASAGLNLALPAAQQGRRADRADLLRRLATLDIEATEIDARAWKFSGGEAQRVAFVRSMAHGPDLIFADEPTSNVDYRNAVEIMGQLRAWAHDPDRPARTVLWITHDLRLAAAVADAVLILHPGVTAALTPVQLPGDRTTDREQREATLERWTYDRAAMIADAPPAYVGAAPPGAGPMLERPRPPLGQRLLVETGVVLKVGLSEVFSRKGAQRRDSVRHHVNPALSLATAAAGADRGLARRLRDALVALWAWTLSFGQGTAVLYMLLIMFLGTAGIAGLGLVDAHFERSVNDPRNCHVIVKTSRTRDQGAGYGDLDALAARPWAPTSAPGGSDVAAAPVTADTRATCKAGDAAYGRIFARGFSMALADGETCPSVGTTSVLLLTADQREPVWSETRLLAVSQPDPAASFGVGAPVAAGASLAEYFDHRRLLVNDEIYLAADQPARLGFDDPTAIIDRTLCLLDAEAGWTEPVRLRVRGVIDEVPNWERNRFDGYIPRYTYDAFRNERGLNNSLIGEATHIALYFASSHVDALKAFLTRENYVFVADNLEKIRRLVGTADGFKLGAKVFLGLVGGLLVAFTVMSVWSYLSANAQSFALLKAFGMSWRFMFGILLVEITVGWLLAALLLALLILGTGLGLTWLGNPVGGAWLQFDHVTLGAAGLWQPYLIASAAVWCLSAGVSLLLTLVWWWQNRYVAQTLKAG